MVLEMVEEWCRVAQRMLPTRTERVPSNVSTRAVNKAHIRVNVEILKTNSHKVPNKITGGGNYKRKQCLRNKALCSVEKLANTKISSNRS